MTWLEERNKAIELLKEIRNNPDLWKSGRYGGADNYAGLPPFCRIIDDLLTKIDRPFKRAS